MSLPSSGPSHCHSTPRGSSEDGQSEGQSEVQKRRRAFERESSNIQLLSSPGMAFGVSSQRGVGSGRSQEQPHPPRTPRHEEVVSAGADLAIGEETGQKEKVFPAPQPERVTRPPPPRLPSPPVTVPEDVGRESPVLSQQIARLRVQNEQLQQQLREREAEKERLSKQLEAKDRGARSNYSPIGLPSRVLDGRQVLRDSHPSSTTPPPRPLTPSSPLSPSPRLPSSPKPFGSEFKSEMLQLSELRRTNRHLEQRLVEVVEDKRRLEVELQRQKDTVEKVQEREQDLTQDIETLRTENSHHSGAISRLKQERDKLKSSNSVYQSQLSSLKNKLDSTEKCYGEVEQENLSLQAEIKQLFVDKDLLTGELMKLQSTMEDALKTKENYRSTIRQLREQIMSLEGQLNTTEHAHIGEVKVQRSPVRKEQAVLSEVLSLRQERIVLKDRLSEAQHEIDSLEATLREHQEVDGLQFRGPLTAILLGFREQVLSISADLQQTKDAVAMATHEQASAVHESFVLLAEQCRQELQQAVDDKGQIADTLAKAEASLVSLQEDYERLRRENEKLVSQKSSVSADVSRLRSEVKALQDQKRMLEVRLSQSHALSQQRDEEVRELREERSKVEERLRTSEQRWRNEFTHLEREWEGKVAMATQAHELLIDSKEALELEKVELERKLSGMEHDNEQLQLVKVELEGRVTSLGDQLSALNRQSVEKERLISSCQASIARLLVERSVQSAAARLASEAFRARLDQVKQDSAIEVEAAKMESEELSKSLKTIESERASLLERFSGVAEKEAQLNTLTTKVAVLNNEREMLETKLQLVTKKHSKAQQDIQSLMDTEQQRALDNEKLKMTLTTEIELLKSKLKILEEGHEVKGSKDTKPTSAFQLVPQSRPVEQLPVMRGALQSEGGKEKRRTSSNDSLSSRLALADLQSRLTGLEVENSQLKEAASEATRGGQEALEVMNTLRKQISELSRRGFYLESEKKQLLEKLKTVQGNQKATRDVREKQATERIHSLQQENQMLLDRVRTLEGALTKKMMSADLKIVQTIKENDKLRQKLVKVYSSLEKVRLCQTGLEDLLVSLREQSSILNQLKQSIDGVKASVLQLEFKQTSPRRQVSPPLSQVGGAGGLSVTFVRSTVTSNSGLVVRTQSPVATTTKAEQLRERNEELSRALHKQAEGVHSLEDKLSTLTAHYTTLLHQVEACVTAGHDMCEGVGSVREWDLRPDQLKSVKVLEQKLESLQDQVIDRESALQDIEIQMRKDYSEHDKKFTSLKSQLMHLIEQLTNQNNFLRTKDLYIQQLEEKQVVCEGQLYQTHKELERVKRDLISHGGPGGQTNMAEIVRTQGEDILQLQKLVSDFCYDITQLQGQLDTATREKTLLQSKTLELERMHLQVKDTVSEEIEYLRKLNMHLVNQQVKTEKASEILKEVKQVQKRFELQRDTVKLEAELDSTKLLNHELSRRISELEDKLTSQSITIKLMQAEKDHAFLLSQRVKDLPHQIGGRSGTGYLRPHSAEARSSQMWKYKLGGKGKEKSLGGTGRTKPPQIATGEFSIALPFGQGVDILDLELPPEPRQSHIQLGPAVVTDDEFPQDERGLAKTKTLRPTKSRFRGHRRTASTGSDVIPPLKEPMGNIKQSEGGVAHPPSLPSKLKESVQQWYPRRPGSAGSTRLTLDFKTVEEVGVVKNQHSSIRGRTTSLGGVPLGQSSLVKKFPDSSHPKLANKSTDSSETTSSESKSSQSDNGGVVSGPPGKIAPLEEASQGAGPGTIDPPDSSTVEIKHTLTQDLVRHESCSSSSSIYRAPLFPSRTPSFYDGSESSPYESASLEIGDSVENLQMFTHFGSYPSPYLLRIKPDHTSSSDDDCGPTHPTRRKKSAGVVADGSHESRRQKDPSDNSNSSCDSDQLHQEGGYRGNKSASPRERDGIPVHRNESISVTEMENYCTDIEQAHIQNEKKVADLRKNLGRKRFSSTGSMKICYSESSNTSLEDISRN